MPRTPLMSLVRKMAASVAAEHRAEAQDLPRHTPDRHRRALLTGGAAAAAAAGFGLRPAAGLAATTRIAVVGAGLAGLTAAYRLQQQGYSPIVFEGNTRLGGRCYTLRNLFEEGQIAEHGGEFIDSDHYAIRGLVRQLGLELDDVLAAQPAGTTELYRFDGQPYTLANATVDYRPLYPVVQAQNKAIGATINYRQSTAAAKKFDAMTLRQWIAAYVPGGGASKLGQLLDNAFSEENAADTDRQSALNIIYTIAPDPIKRFNLYYTGSDQRFHVHGGNDQITTLLGERLGPLVQTGSVLLAIAQRPDGTFRLTIGRDQARRDAIFDRVILALPFAVMKAAVDFSAAGFRPLKQRAIRELGMGASVKLQLQFRRRLWNRLGCNGEIRLKSKLFQTSWDVTRAQPGQEGIFNFWSGGSQALTDGTFDTRLLCRLCLAEAEAILPGLSGLWNGISSIDVWKNNPWSLGSYSYYGPGYQTTVYGIESQPEGQCYFAGEHTWSQAGYLNAGVASGDRAAAQVLKSLSA